MPDFLDVSDETPRVAYTATASQTVFPFDFIIFEEANLVVYQNEDVLTLGDDYTVEGEGEEEGGTVTLLTGATAGDSIILVRVLPIEQETHIPASGPLNIPAINLELSRHIAIMQQIADSISRVVTLPDSDPSASLVIPALSERFGKLLGFDSNDGSLVASENTLETLDALLSGALSAESGLNHIRVVTTYAALRDLETFTGAIVWMRGFYAPNDGGEGVFYWDSASTATHNIGTIVQPNAGGTGRWLRANTAHGFHADWFGTKGDGTSVFGGTVVTGTNDDAAIAAAVTAAVAAEKSLLFTSGKAYCHSDTLEFGYHHFTVTSTGTADFTLRHQGSGVAVSFNESHDDLFLYGFRFLNGRIAGNINGNTTYCLKANGLAHGCKVVLTAGDATTRLVSLRRSVGCEWELHLAGATWLKQNGSRTFNHKPSGCLQIDEQSQRCRIWVEAEDATGSYSVYVYDSALITFTGTIESNDNFGLFIDATCRDILLEGLDMEDNGTGDVRDQGVNTIYRNCLSVGVGDNNIVLDGTGSRGALFEGGYYRKVELTNSPGAPTFINCRFPRGAGGGVVENSNDYSRINCVTEDDSDPIVVTRLHDILGSRFSFSLLARGANTAGTLTYASNTISCERYGQFISCSGRFDLASNSGGDGTAELYGWPFEFSDVVGYPVTSFDSITLPGGRANLSLKPPTAGSAILQVVASGTGAGQAGVDIDDLGTGFIDLAFTARADITS